MEQDDKQKLHKNIQSTILNQPKDSLKPGTALSHLLKHVGGRGCALLPNPVTSSAVHAPIWRLHKSGWGVSPPYSSNAAQHWTSWHTEHGDLYLIMLNRYFALKHVSEGSFLGSLMDSHLLGDEFLSLVFLHFEIRKSIKASFKQRTISHSLWPSSSPICRKTTWGS